MSDRFSVPLRFLAVTALAATLSACAAPRGTGDLGIVVERVAGDVLVVETTGRTQLARVAGLGDLSHASAVYSRDGRYAYVFGRDGGLTKVDLLGARIVKRGRRGNGAERQLACRRDVCRQKAVVLREHALQLQDEALGGLLSHAGNRRHALVVLGHDHGIELRYRELR